MRKETRCASCAYHGNFLDSHMAYCDYLCMTGRRRPCPGGEACTEYKPIGGKKKGQRVALRLRKDLMG